MQVAAAAWIWPCCGSGSRPAGTDLIRPLAWEFPYATSLALEKTEKTKKKNATISNLSISISAAFKIIMLNFSSICILNSDKYYYYLCDQHSFIFVYIFAHSFGLYLFLKTYFPSGIRTNFLLPEELPLLCLLVLFYS